MNATATPLVSVIIPTYNQAHYLVRALQSVLDQTYINWEAIVIDNYSTDNTDEVMADFADPSVTYLKIHNNGVIAASRNEGIRAAKGEWVAFLDSDDWWTVDKLNFCVDCIQDKVDFVYHNLKIVRDPPSLFKIKHTKCRQVKKPVLKDLLLKGNTIATSSVVVRKGLLEQIGGMDESVEMIAAEDYNTWLRIAQLTDSFVFVPHSLGYYLFHSEGASRKNMEELVHCVCGEFMYLLGPQEKVIYEATARYVTSLNDFYSNKFSNTKKNLPYSIRYGSLPIKIKSLLLYVILSIKFWKIN
jgi:glycosyltransferase involved in cell wall biosynthesis